ncbi:MAG TPA: hypothetical protein VF808_13980 [Ktedonobacterales bacterium]
MMEFDFATIFLAVLLAPMVIVSGLLALCGLVMVYSGRGQARDPQGKLSWGKRALTKLLHQRLPALRFASMEQQVDLFNQVMALTGWIKIGMGWALTAGSATLVALSLALFALASYHLAILLIVVGALLLLFIALTTLSLAVGALVGFQHGARLAGRARATLAPGVWVPRRGSDYRARWLDWVFGLATIALLAGCGFAMVAYPRFGLSSGALEGASTEPVFAFIALSEVASALVWFFAARGVASAPRAITSPYEGLANDAEDFMRSMYIGVVTQTCCSTSSWTAMAFGLALIFTGLFAGLPFSLLFVAVGMLGSLVASCVALFRGRLGGRRAGWPWSALPAGVPTPAAPYQG